MTPFESAVSFGSFVAAGIGIAYVAYVVKSSGRDRPHDPAAVQRLLDVAPYERLDKVLDK